MRSAEHAIVISMGILTTRASSSFQLLAVQLSCSLKGDGKTSIGSLAGAIPCNHCMAAQSID
jgi:hypothetical protein